MFSILNRIRKIQIVFVISQSYPYTRISWGRSHLSKLFQIHDKPRTYAIYASLRQLPVQNRNIQDMTLIGVDVLDTTSYFMDYCRSLFSLFPSTICSLLRSSYFVNAFKSPFLAISKSFESKIKSAISTPF